MRINDGSICRGCEHFEHQCDVSDYEFGYDCYEDCRNSNNSIVENFHKDGVIIKCKAFEDFLKNIRTKWMKTEPGSVFKFPINYNNLKSKDLCKYKLSFFYQLMYYI